MYKPLQGSKHKWILGFTQISIEKKGNIYKWNQNKIIYGFYNFKWLTIFFFKDVRECLAFMEQ